MRASLDRVVSWLYGTKPPLWFRLFLVLTLGLMTAGLFSSRGVVVGAVMGVAAGVVFGAMALTALLAWDQWVAWSRKHQPLENLVSFPLMFLVIASTPILPCTSAGSSRRASSLSAASLLGRLAAGASTGVMGEGGDGAGDLLSG